MGIIGREPELEQIASLRGVVLVAGDSGVGKSAVPEEAQQRCQSAVAPRPVVVAYSPGALQRALLEALGDAVGLVASDETGAERAVRLIEGVAAKVAEARLKDLARGVGRHLLDIVRTRVSPAAADLIAQAAQAMSETLDESLVNRISSAGDDDVIDIVVQLAADVLALAGQPLILALDEAHRLDDGDRRRLKDLVSKLPDDVVVRAAFTVAHAGDHAAVEDLAASGLQVRYLSGLDETTVRDLVGAAGLDARLVGAVMAATNGYALYVGAAIDLLQADPSPTSLEGLEPSDALVNATRQAWGGLSVPARVAATRLAAYRDRVPPDRACALLDVDPIAWSDLEAELVRTHIFVSAPVPWFHERRRAVVWDVVLTDSGRTVAREAAWADLTSQLGPAPSADLLIELAQLGEEDPGLAGPDISAQAVLGLTDGELAVAASLLELVEPPGAVSADHVLEHARALYSLGVDFVDSARSLTASELVVIAENDNAAVLAPAWGTPLALQLAIGRAARRLGRVPLPRLASAVFDRLLRPEIGAFHGAHYGIGTPGTAELGKMAAEAQRLPRNGVVVMSDRWPSALIWGEVSDVPFYAAVGFNNATDRNRFLEHVSGMKVDFFGQTFAVTSAMKHPVFRRPSLRVGRALERAGGGINLHGLTASRLPSPIPLEQSLTDVLQVRRVIRELLPDDARDLFGVGEPTGMLWFTDSHGTFVIEISESDEVRDEPALGTIRPFGAFTSIELAQTLGFGPTQRVLHQRWSGGGLITNDPIAEEVVQVSKRARLYNSTQARRVLRLDPNTLEEMFTAEAREVERIAAALAEAFPTQLSPPGPRTTYVLLSDDFVRPGFVPGAVSSSIVARCEAEGDVSSVRLKMVPDAAASAAGAWGDHSWIEREFGEEPSPVRTISHSGALDTVAGC